VQNPTQNTGSRNGLWITIGVVLALAIVVALVVAYSGGGGSAAGGAGY
jgi:hypothetical protein